MSLDATLPSTVVRRTAALPPVPLDHLLGTDGDWIAQHRCRETEIEGPLRAAEAEIERCSCELESIKETMLDGSEDIRSIQSRFAYAMAIHRPLIVQRVRLVFTLNEYWYQGGAKELAEVKVYTPSFYWLLLNEIFDLQDAVRDALASFRLSCALASGLASAVTQAISSILLRNLLKALTVLAKGITWPIDNLKVACITAGGGATSVYIPRI